jgi:hypothetical protein
VSETPSLETSREIIRLAESCMDMVEADIAQLEEDKFLFPLRAILAREDWIPQKRELLSVLNDVRDEHLGYLHGETQHTA